MAIIATDHYEPPDAAIISDIYIDESSQTRHRYLVIGGLIVAKVDIARVEREMARVRLPELPSGEMKWGKVSNAKVMAYKRVVDAFFDGSSFVGVHYHSLIVDTHDLDDKVYNKGSREIGFNKEVYQLASKFARLYKSRLFHLYPDHRDTNQTPNDLRLMLNRGIRKAGDRRDWPYRRCHFRDSKTTPMLQMVDVFTGAIAYYVNGHVAEPGASEAKTRLARYVLRRAGITDVMRDTAISGKFTVWHRRLQARGGRPPVLG